MRVAPGDVIAIFDPYTRPAKIKWHVCVAEQPVLFLRINSNPLFRPNHPLTRYDNSWLKHDSYVELARVLEFSPAEVSAAVISGYKGRLTPQARRDLAHAVLAAETLTQEQKELISLHLDRDQDVADSDT